MRLTGPNIFHLLMIILLFSHQVGAYYDAWYHIHYGFLIETFFTPTHYILYGTWLAIALLIAVFLIRGAWLRRIRNEWLPAGYNVSAIGALLFGIGGGIDLLWHQQFGFEQNLAAAISPAHMWLLAAEVLMILGVLRHSLLRREFTAQPRSSSFIASLPLTVALAFLLQAFMWPTWYFDLDYASGGALVRNLDAFKSIDFTGSAAQIAGTAGILLNAMILVPFVIVSLYRWRLPVGSLTLIVSYYSILRAFSMGTYAYLPAMIGGAVLGDIVWAWTRSGGEERLSSTMGYRLIALLVPLVQSTLYFSTMALLPAGIIWPVHLWGSMIALTSLAGLLFSFGLIDGSRRVSLRT